MLNYYRNAIFYYFISLFCGIVIVINMINFKTLTGFRVNKTNITKLLLTEFYTLSKSDIEIQINKNYDSLREMNQPKVIENHSKDNEIENMIQKFYLSLSNYFSKNTGSDFVYDNSKYASYNSFKKNYMKFLKFNEESLNKIST
jgi:hypothetical protein